MTKEQAERFLTDYCMDPVPDESAAIARLMEIDEDSELVDVFAREQSHGIVLWADDEHCYVAQSQDEIDALIYGAQ